MHEFSIVSAGVLVSSSVLAPMADLSAQAGLDCDTVLEGSINNYLTEENLQKWELLNPLVINGGRVEGISVGDVINNFTKSTLLEDHLVRILVEGDSNQPNLRINISSEGFIYTQDTPVEGVSVTLLEGKDATKALSELSETESDSIMNTRRDLFELGVAAPSKVRVTVLQIIDSDAGVVKPVFQLQGNDREFYLSQGTEGIELNMYNSGVKVTDFDGPYAVVQTQENEPMLCVEN